MLILTAQFVSGMNDLSENKDNNVQPTVNSLVQNQEETTPAQSTDFIWEDAYLLTARRHDFGRTAETDGRFIRQVADTS